MKRLVLIAISIITSVNAFASWHKADLFYADGSIARSEIKLPEETFEGMFKRVITVKNGDDEDYVTLHNINKVILSNGLTFVKFENNGKPVLLEQITQYDGVNLLILPKQFSPDLVENAHYIYRLNGNDTFEDQPIGYDAVGSRDFTATQAYAYTEVRTFTANPLRLYSSTVIRNGHLYVPGSEDYLYLMKGDKIERLQTVHTYAVLAKFMGDNQKVNIAIKQGLSNFTQLSSLIAYYNAALSLNMN